MSQNTIIRQLVSRPSSMKSILQPPRRLAIATTSGSHIISWKEIRYCESMSNYCTLHLRSGRKIVLSKTLSAVSSILPKPEFVRVHQSYLVNINCIRFAGTDRVELEGDIELPVARSRRKELTIRISEISLSL